MGDVILTGFWLIVSALGITVGIGLYGLPTIIAIVRKSPNIALIATVNLVLGGLFVPWWIALGMALWSTVRRGDVTVIQTTSLPLASPAGPHPPVQAGPSVQAQAALPAAPPAQPPTQTGTPEDRPHPGQRPSPARYGFAPPSPYRDASPASQRPSPGQGR